MLKEIICFKHLLTPIAIIKRQRSESACSIVKYSTLYIFGIRILYWTIS